MLDYRNAPPDGQPQSFPLTRAPKVCSKSARATLIAFFCILAPATDGTAQAWNEGLTDSFFSVGVSFGGGTFASLHLEAHFLASGKDTDGNDMRKAGVEVVLGFPRHEVAPGNKDFAVSLGTNVRITGRAGISGIAGFRTLVWTPPDAGGGFRKVWQIGLGQEVYPIPFRGTLFLGVGQRLVPPGEESSMGQALRSFRNPAALWLCWIEGRLCEYDTRTPCPRPQLESPS